MIINGGSRRNGGYFAQHLLRTDQNDRVVVVEIRGVAADTVRDAFREMKAVASGTRCENFFYHANINTRDSEPLTPEQWAEAADRLEQELGLSEQPRIVVEHEKDGRTHRHIVWSRIDVDSMTAIPDSLTYPKHELVARELEARFNLEPVASVLVKDRDTPRPERNPKDWESLRASETGLDPKAMKAELTALWRSADSGQAFMAALEDRGYILARGDRRDFCVIDQAGDEHSLGRRLSGVKAADIRERLADLDRKGLPSVAEARLLAAQAATGEGGGDTPDLAPAAPQEASGAASGPFEQIHAELLDRVRATLPELGPVSSVTKDALISEIHAKTVAQAEADALSLDSERETESSGRFGRVRAWWANMREHFSGWRDHLQDRFDHYRTAWGRDHDTHQQDDTPSP